MKTSATAAALVSVLSGNPDTGVDIKKSYDFSKEIGKIKQLVESQLDPTRVDTKLNELGIKSTLLTSGKISKDGNIYYTDDQGYTIMSPLVAGPGGVPKYVVKNLESGHFEFETKVDVDLFNEYNKKLGGGEEYFAYELVKGRSEFIENIIKTKRFDRYKTIEDKIKRADRGWQSIIRNIFRGIDSSGYKRIIEFSPKLTKYIIDNYNELSLNKQIVGGLSFIKMEYDTIENNRIADENNRIANELNSLTGR